MANNETSKLGRRATRFALVLTVTMGALSSGAGCGGGGGGGGPTGTDTPATTTPGTPSTGGTAARASAANGTSATAGTSAAATDPAANPATQPIVAPGMQPASNTSAAANPAAAAPAAASASAPAAAPASAPAAAPASAPAGPSAANHPGTIIPLYSSPASGTWAAVAAAKRAHPSVPVIAVVNPNSGPGTAALSDYMAGIADLTAAGVKVLGYVHTSYGQRAAAEIQADIDRWHSLYSAVSGIFFDEMANTAGLESFYSGVNAYAKSHGYTFTVGNPGADGAATYVGTVDTILVYENRGLPPLASLGGWHNGYDRKNFGIIPYGVSGVDAAFVRSATLSCGYVYLSSDDLPNPWDTVPAYLDGLVATLSTL